MAVLTPCKGLRDKMYKNGASAHLHLSIGLLIPVKPSVMGFYPTLNTPETEKI